MEQCACLRQPIRIGRMLVKNRMVMPPMNTNYSNENGAVTEQMIAYLEQRAKHDVGLFVVEACTVSDDSRNHPVQPKLTDDRFIPGWAELTDRLHGYGAKVSLELAHYGSEGAICERVSASDISHYLGPVRSLTVPEIERIEEQFVEAACRAKTAGFDAVTLHAAHGYGLAQFLSPLYNKREDQYGGSLENRARIVTEIIHKCKKRLGRAYPVMVRYSIHEFCLGGTEITQAVQLAKLFERAGADALDLSSGVPSAGLFNVRPAGLRTEDGFLSAWSKTIKENVSVPVICAGGFHDPKRMREDMESGCMDMIAIGRSLIADEAFCSKLCSGQEQRIRKCLRCQECFVATDGGWGLRCSVNPRTGREYTEKNRAASAPKRVLVVGAGAAGLSAALTLSKAGHQVTLCDKASELGGTLLAAGTPPEKFRIHELVRWYAQELQATNTELRLSCPFSRALLDELQPDVVVFAIGSDYARFIPGSDLPMVMTAAEALRSPEQVGKRIVIVGGGASGAETAEYFSSGAVRVIFDGVDAVRNRTLLYHTEKQDGAKKPEVTIIEVRDAICADDLEDNADIMRVKLHENGVKILTGVGAQRIENGRIWVRKLPDGEPFALEADTVILAAGLRPKKIPILQGYDGQIIQIGDCAEPGKIKDAIYAGWALAQRI